MRRQTSNNIRGVAACRHRRLKIMINQPLIIRHARAAGMLIGSMKKLFIGHRAETSIARRVACALHRHARKCGALKQCLCAAAMSIMRPGSLARNSVASRRRGHRLVALAR